MKYLLLILAPVMLISCGDMMKAKTTIKFENNAPYEFQLLQRQTKDIPSENGKVDIGIGDITGGQAWLTINKDSVSVFEQSIHQGDTLNFKIDESPYKITCIELINNLIGDDLGTFKILP